MEYEYNHFPFHTNRTLGRARGGIFVAAEQGDEADEAFGGTVTRTKCRLMPAPANGMDAGTAAQLIPGVVSSERRNISAMIRATCSRRPRWSDDGRATPGV